MTDAKGYDQIKKIAFLGLALGQSFTEAKAATTVIGKTEAYFSSIDEMVAMLGFNRDELEAELGDWHDDDKAKLLQECKDHFKINDPDLEIKIEESIGIGLDFLALVERSIETWKGTPKP